MGTDTDSLVRFACCKCAVRLRAMPAQRGRKLACPKCGAENQVPGDVPDNAARQTRRQPVGDVPVVCGLCATRMYATHSQIGTKIQCPDCNSMTEVKQPTKRPATGLSISPPAEDDDGYALRDDVTTPEMNASEPRCFVFFCKLCSTQMRATADQVGEVVRCPDCELEMSIPAPAVHNEPAQLVDEGPELIVGTAAQVEQAELMEHEKLRVVDSQVTAPAGLRREYGFADDPEPPKYPFASRVVSFLFYDSTRTNWVALGLMFAPLWYALGLSLEMASGSSTERGLAMLMFVGAFMCSTVWASASAACLLAIVGETAAGNDKIVEWPQLLDITAWAGGAFYGVNALAVSAAPAAIITSLVGVSTLWIPVVAIAAVYLILPPVLLSMLANNSPMGVYSSDVVRSMRANIGACLRFYGATGLVYAAVGGACFALLQIEGFLPAILAGMLVAMATFLIARLIGRLGWVLSQASALSPDEEDLTERKASAS